MPVLLQPVKYNDVIIAVANTVCLGLNFIKYKLIQFVNIYYTKLKIK